MVYGSMPNDGGYFILTEEERQTLLSGDDSASQYIRPYMGGDELINGRVRWCLWLKGVTEQELLKHPEILWRVKGVEKCRLESTREATRKLAETPTLFGEDRQPDSSYLIVPITSSERRRYMPMGYADAAVVTNSTSLMLPGASLYEFGILSSRLHNVWIETVGGKLETRTRYSAGLVYNNFIWPNPSEAQRQHIETCAQAVLDARAEHPEATLARLYDPDNMPDNLRAAHQRLDAAVEAAYGVDFGGDEERIVEHLFKLYARAAADAKE